MLEIHKRHAYLEAENKNDLLLFYIVQRSAEKTVEQKEEVLARPPQSVDIEIFHFLEFFGIQDKNVTYLSYLK